MTYLEVYLLLIEDLNQSLHKFVVADMREEIVGCFIHRKVN